MRNLSTMTSKRGLKITISIINEVTEMDYSEFKKQAYKRPGVKAAYEEMEPEFSL